MSADRPRTPGRVRARRALSATLPRWLMPTLGGWTLVCAAALGNATAMPVRAGVVVMVLAALAVGHGVVHRRWWIAAPVALALLVIALADLAGAMPDGMQTSWPGGPAAGIAPRIIWVLAAIVSAVDIVYGIVLHVRTRSAVQELDTRPSELQRQVKAADADVRDRVRQLDDSIAALEDLLTTVR